MKCYIITKGRSSYEKNLGEKRMIEHHDLKFIDEDHDRQRCINQAMANAEQLCQRRGQRFTALRRRVFELVWCHHKPIGAYDLLEKLQRDGRTAPPTVYRALDFLLELGLIHRITSLNAYVGCSHPEDLHDGQFLICTACRSYAELNVESISNAIDDSARDSGFAVQRHTVEIMGLCPRCQDKQVTS